MPVATFDMIGTFFSLAPIEARLRRLGAPPGAVWTWFFAAQRDFFGLSHAGRYTPFAPILRDSLPRALAILGVEAAADEVAAIAGSFADLAPEAGAVEAVARLRAGGWRVLALTNGAEAATRSMLEACGAAASFEAVLSCDAIGVSKPNPAVYRMAIDMAGGEPAWMIAAHAWDCAGAALAGMRTCWIATEERVLPAYFPAPDLTAGNIAGAVDRLLTA